MATKTSNCGTTGRYIGLLDIGTGAYAVTDTANKRLRSDCLDEMKKEMLCYADRQFGAGHNRMYTAYIIDTETMQIAAHAGKPVPASLPWVDGPSKKS